MENKKKKPNTSYYRLDKSFGPPGAAAGFFLLTIGVITIFKSFSGAILIVLGSFMAFSSSGCTVDFDNFRIRFSNDLFGFIRVGGWRYVSPKMSVGIAEDHRVYRVYSLSNRSVGASTDDFRVSLYINNERKGMAICRFKKLEDALEELPRLSDLLGLPIREGKYNNTTGRTQI